MKTSNNFWLGDESSFLSFLGSEKKIHETSVSELQNVSIQAMTEAAQSQSEFGEFGYMIDRVGNVGIVTVSGHLVTRNAAYNRYYGRVSYDEIRNAVFAASDHPGVQAILLNMDTPGGAASGVSELSDFLDEVDKSVKPLYTYAGTMMASGGYWLGSIGREIYASKLATVGSIGVITVHASYEQMYKDMGIDITVLRVGEFKALGTPYEKLDEKSKAQMESQMNTIYDVFLETVSENRKIPVQKLKKTAAEGRVFVGADSVTVGLVDRISSFDAAVEAISKKVKPSIASQPQRFSLQTSTGDTPMPGKNRVLTEAGIAALAEGVAEAEVLADPTLSVEQPETPAEQTPAVAAAAVAEEGAAAPAAPASGAPAGAQQPSEGASAALFDTMFTKINDLTVKVAELSAQLSTVTQERDKHKSSESALIKIAGQAINRMQVSLGGAAIKVDEADAATVLEQYNRTYSEFNRRFKVGASARVAEDADLTPAPERAQNPSVEAGVLRLTTNRIK